MTPLSEHSIGTLGINLGQRKRVRAGAIITVAGQEQVKEPGNEETTPSQSLSSLGMSPIACQEFLGRTLLQCTRQDLHNCGVEQQTVLFEQPGLKSFTHSAAQAAEGFSSAWEAAVTQQLNDGAGILVLIRLGAYLEIDFRDLFRFHCETSNGLTQVYGRKGAFDLGLVSADQLRTHAGSYRRRLSALIPNSARYNFAGYSNRLDGPRDFRRLVDDALTGRNSILPNGERVGPGLWLAEGAKVDAGALLCAPAYIGAYSQVKSSCVIQGGSAIERNCVVDFGTTVTESCVLPGTYLGMGLDVVRSIVAPNRLFHLERNLGIEISDPHLVGTRLPASILGGLKKSITEKVFLNGASANSVGNFSHL